MPETDNVSSVIAVRSASVFWVLVATTRRAFPTRTVSHRNNGRSSKDKIVSGIEMINIVMIVLTIVSVFESTVEAVSATTDWTPATPVASRDRIAPGRVVLH